MDLTRALTRLARRRVHVLLVDAPGALTVRWAVEDALARRGWVAATWVADADVLLTCGEPGTALAGAVDDVWQLMTLPRARAHVGTAAEVDDVLDRAARALADPADRRPPTGDHPAGDGDGPGGLPLASGAPDRDGLEMDVLHVPLGPVLPAWPAGLLLTATLAGDVVTGVAVEVLPGAPGAAVAPGQAGRVETVARVLELAGRADLADRARVVRASVDADDAAPTGWTRVRRVVDGSRALRWSLRGLGLVDPVLLADHRLPAGLAGDVLDRLRAAADLAVGWPGPAPAGWRERLLGLLPELLAGRELAEVRLLLAGLPVDLTVGVPRTAAQHG